MNTFAAMADHRTLERRLFPEVRSFAELDAITFIGLCQERGEVLTLKRLGCQGFSTRATLARCVARLKILGLVTEEKSPLDRRNHNLKLSPAVQKGYEELVAARRA